MGTPTVVWPHLEKYSPLMVRLMAHRPARNSTKKCVGLTNAEIAIASGLPLKRVQELSRLTEWDSVTVGEMQSFFIACGFDPTDGTHRSRVQDYERMCINRKTRPFQWLHNSPVYEEEFLPLIQILNASLSRNQHVA